MNKNENYILLIQKKLIDDISESELTDLTTLMDEIDSDKKIYGEYAKLWDSLNTPQPDKPFNKIKSLEQINKQILIAENKNLQYSYFKWAAAAVIIIASIFVFKLVTQNNYKTLNTANDEVLRFTLPDNSRIVLNENSQLEYLINDEEDTRSIILDGECFFDVQKDSKPFVIETNNSLIKVLGTKFNIKQRKETTTLSVNSGKVNIKSLYGEVIKVLTTNMLSSVIKNNEVTEPIIIDPDSISSWTYGEYEFKNKTFEEILLTLSKEYNFKYEVTDKTILDKKISASFTHKKLDVILESLAALHKLKVTKVKNRFVFSPIVD